MYIRLSAGENLCGQRLVNGLGMYTGMFGIIPGFYPHLEHFVIGLDGNSASESADAKDMPGKIMVGVLVYAYAALITRRHMFFASSSIKMFSDKDNLLSDSSSGEFKAYNEGYTNGLTWPDAWKHRPGGPWVYTAGYRYCCNRDGKGCNKQVSPRFTCRENIDYAAQSAAQHKCWLQGWEAGHIEKIKSGKSYSIEEHNAFTHPGV